MVHKLAAGVEVVWPHLARGQDGAILVQRSQAIPVGGGGQGGKPVCGLKIARLTDPVGHVHDGLLCIVWEADDGHCCNPEARSPENSQVLMDLRWILSFVDRLQVLSTGGLYAQIHHANVCFEHCIYNFRVLAYFGAGLTDHPHLISVAPPTPEALQSLVAELDSAQRRHME